MIYKKICGWRLWRLTASQHMYSTCSPPPPQPTHYFSCKICHHEGEHEEAVFLDRNVSVGGRREELSWKRHLWLEVADKPGFPPRTFICV